MIKNILSKKNSSFLINYAMFSKQLELVLLGFSQML